MAVPQAQLRQAIADHLEGFVVDARVHAFQPDTFAPPGIVVKQGTVRWATEPGERTWCTRSWVFPIVAAVSRAHDKDGQDELDRLLDAVELAFDTEAPDDGVLEGCELLDAAPVNVTASGNTYPGYEIHLAVLA